MSWLLAVCPVLGIIAMAMSVSHMLPVAISLALGDGITSVFLFSTAANFAAGALLWLLTRHHRHELQLREGILLIILVWTGGALFATLPLFLAIPGLSFTDAYFEAMSGLTATGATLLEGLEYLPPSVNVWRAELQWLGGMGVIVLVVAVLPMIGVGGRQISKAEIPGPMKDQALTPRITQTAKGLWIIYVALTAACLLAYRWAGMSWLDALIHSFTTVALGGFSSYDASIGYFNSPLIEGVAIVFMLLAGINFATHFLAWQGRGLAAYRRDSELPWYLLVLGASVALVTVFLWTNGIYADWTTALRHAAFHTVSIATTTGYSTLDYGLWPAFAPLWILFLGTFIASSGSAGGGIKMMRAMTLFSQVFREFRKLSHPNAVTPLKIGGQVVPNQIVFSVLAFFFAWLATLVSMTFLLTVTGLDFITALSAVVATLNNIGPGLQQVGPASNYSVLSDFQTWVCSATMLLGRLELMTVLVVLTPSFWRK
jgi:trk system potassium uptake protein TrkH